MGALRPSFFGGIMRKNTKNLTYGAIIASLYVVLTYLQNFLFPNSVSAAIQFRASEALCVLAFFTPVAIPGLTVGCFLFNISNAAALPLDFLVGTAATALSTGAMYLTRKITLKGFPWMGLLMPALFNGVLVGWELAFHIGGGFWYNSICVAIGELWVLFTLGVMLYYLLKTHRKQFSL